LFLGLAEVALAQGGIEKAIARYNEAFRSKDVATVHALLSEDVLLYEHSVKNDGREDVFENHLKPEILEFENVKLDFTDVRVTPGTDLALVTRRYTLDGTYQGKPLQASANETMVWKRVGAEWKIVHIHYSHPCPRPPG
jgi:ketosteroid isomerase-like protein